MVSDPLLVLAALLWCVVVSELLARHTVLRHGGTALIVIVVTAVIANAGIIPAGSTDARPVPIYDAIFEWLAPLAIFWLVLRVDLRRALSVGWPLLVCFALGVAGTTLGVIAGLSAVGGEVIGPHAHAVAGMFAATYTGGSANFNAVALHYDIVREGTLYAGAVAVDAGLTAVWMVVTIVVPRWLRRGIPRDVQAVDDARAPDPDEERVAPYDLAVLSGVGMLALWAATAVSERLADAGIAIPMMLILTALALALGQLRWVSRLRGMNVLGMLAVYLFLAVIGAFCDLSALAALGRLGVSLSIFAVILLAVHGLVTFGGAAALRLDPDAAAIASQANIGGGSTALALARSLGRPDLVLPAILIGSLGTAVGTFVGFFVAAQLAP
ncbi:MAG: DUF819 family protein [Myxococcota bacterium]